MEEFTEEYPEESTNRSFVIASIALGGIFVAGLLALGLYLFKVKPTRISANATQVAEINASNTQVAIDADATSGAHMILAEAAHVVAAEPTIASTVVPTTTVPTEMPTQAPPTSQEPALVVEPAGLSANASNDTTGSVIEEYSEEYTDSSTTIPVVEVSPATLPNSGFMDEVGLPTLLLAALGLLVVIIVTRTIRQVTNG